MQTKKNVTYLLKDLAKTQTYDRMKLADKSAKMSLSHN